MGCFGQGIACTGMPLYLLLCDETFARAVLCAVGCSLTGVYRTLCDGEEVGVLGGAVGGRRNSWEGLLHGELAE
jgi:hypothetical protein